VFSRRANFAAQPRSKELVYTLGLLLAVILTVTSFRVANNSAIWAPRVPAGLSVLAIALQAISGTSAIAQSRKSCGADRQGWLQ
jgi:heme/copper-type cytochrome/quinol oxidase subunit 4